MRTYVNWFITVVSLIVISAFLFGREIIITAGSANLMAVYPVIYGYLDIPGSEAENTDSGSVSIYNPGDEVFHTYGLNGILYAKINYLPREKGELKVSNIAGQILFVQHIYDEGYYSFPKRLNNGIYIVTLTSGNVRCSKKVNLFNE